MPKAYLWLRDALEPLHLARFGTPSKREEVAQNRWVSSENMGKTMGKTQREREIMLIIIFRIKIAENQVSPNF